MTKSALVGHICCQTGLSGGRRNGHFIPDNTSMFDIMDYLGNPEGMLRGVEMACWHVTTPTPGSLKEGIMICEDSFRAYSARNLGFIDYRPMRRRAWVEFADKPTMQFLLNVCYEEYRGISFTELLVSLRGDSVVITYSPLGERAASG